MNTLSKDNMTPNNTYYTTKSIISENCLWMVNTSRHICVTYVYFPYNGCIHYSASILKMAKGDWPTPEQIKGHEHTTTRRFNIRRANANIGKELSYKDMLRKIRREMCIGQGCVGPRKKIIRYDDDISSVECISDDGDTTNSIIELIDNISTFKHVKTLKYSCIVNESHGDAPFTIRTYYIAFKGDLNTGDAIYGACLSHCGCYSKEEYTEPKINDDSHYETAMMRMEKCPVYINIHDDYKYQLYNESTHCEDVMYSIIDKINTRVGGFMQIKGPRVFGYLD